MRIRVQLPESKWKRRIAQFLLAGGLLVFLVGAGTFLYFWLSFSRLIDSRMSGDIFEHAARIYASPAMLAIGSPATVDGLVAQLRRFGYSDANEPFSTYGTFTVDRNALEIRPGSRSRVGRRHAARVEIEAGKVKGLTSLADGAPVETVLVDPPHITNLFGRDRTKRRLVEYSDIPPSLVQALLTAEDRRFFNHPGISILDGFRVLWYDIGIWTGYRKGARPHGASTLNMQLARSYFLGGDMTLSWKRKFTEAFLAVELDQRFSKEKILELYANEIYLGQRGSFGIHGFGEASQAYFGKDISQLTLSESALLAGLVRGPNYYNPYRNLERVVGRRNIILDNMVKTGALSEEEAAAAKKEEVRLASLNVEASNAPYFVDLMHEKLLARFSEKDLISGGFRVSTTLDLDLQRLAAAAVRNSLKEVDERIDRRYARRKNKPAKVQVTLIALDPHTGAVKALVGGRDYNLSQLNHAVTPRPPGSAFKPFVYAAALGKGLYDPENAITPATTIVDEPTVFVYGNNQEYSPGNFGEQFYGVVTVREALIRSLNVATVKIAEMAGFHRVARLAVAAGMNPRVMPTPSMAIGAYDSTPLEVAGAYTIFSNYGNRVLVGMIEEVLSSEGDALYQRKVESTRVLDPRVAFLVVNLLADNMNRGTGAGTRARGFYAPAAGKTGTSHDAWFVGFTSNLLTIVWVGFDDYRDLGITGSAAALPIWTAFMKEAIKLPAYRNVRHFSAPRGIAFVPIDPLTSQMATPDCPNVRNEVFLAGTQPRDLCPLHRPSVLRRFSRALSGALGIRPKAKTDKKNDENPEIRQEDPGVLRDNNSPKPPGEQPPEELQGRLP